MTRRRSGPLSDPLQRLVTETDDLVARLIGENRALRAQNVRLTRQVEQLSQGWDTLRRLVRVAPRNRA